MSMTDMGNFIKGLIESCDFIPKSFLSSPDRDIYFQLLTKKMQLAEEKNTMCYGLREYEDDDLDIYAEDDESDGSDDEGYPDA